MNLRRYRRAVALGWALVINLIDLAWARLQARLQGRLDAGGRALWLQSACRRVLAAMDVDVNVRGVAPVGGLVVSNHLSYLDIAIFSAVMPCAFVSKAEVGKWPYFGLAARASGTIFIDRTSKTSAAATAAEMRERLKGAVPVLLFPEGTSSDGTDVLRFHSGLFQPAVETGAEVTAAAVRYVPLDGSAEHALCWYENDGFVSHLWRVLGESGFSSEVWFGEGRVYADRRAAAVDTRYEIRVMRVDGQGVVVKPRPDRIYK